MDELDAILRRVASAVRRQTGVACDVEPPSRGEPRAIASPKGLASLIDHTLLRADASEAMLGRLCDEARTHGFFSVCVNSVNVARCRALLGDAKIAVCSVVGFPLGATITAAKALEAVEAVRAGATEIDMVINLGAMRDEAYRVVFDDIRVVIDGVAPAAVKVILETALLSDEEKIAGCLLARAAGARYVKTSTGFGPGGATVEDVALIRRVVGEEMGVKASGGVGTFETAQAMIAAGADRIGSSKSVAIVAGR